MLLKELERDSATKMGAKTLVLPSSHVPMLSHPARLQTSLKPPRARWAKHRARKQDTRLASAARQLTKEL